MFLILLLLLVVALTLLILSVTRAAHRDWKRGFSCLVVGIILFSVFIIQTRRFVAHMKVHAKEAAAQAKMKSTKATAEKEFDGSTNNYSKTPNKVQQDTR
ncbi:MAG: hypothetical protein A2283_07825 [Lentisphaerae bacterium RIFOXYA12_FULL_48_11]|nr:MAG: hypothetical protein A2283_07825 [Lentisphaerae bacterium RIFOXYA12_FULL_48_11]